MRILITGAAGFIGFSLSHHLLKNNFKIFGIDNLDDYYDTTSFVSAIQKRQGFKIACLEEIALKKKWINKKNLDESIKFYGNCDYSKYLKRLIS